MPIADHSQCSASKCIRRVVPHRRRAHERRPDAAGRRSPRSGSGTSPFPKRLFNASDPFSFAGMMSANVFAYDLRGRSNAGRIAPRSGRVRSIERGAHRPAFDPCQVDTLVGGRHAHTFASAALQEGAMSAVCNVFESDRSGMRVRPLPSPWARPLVEPRPFAQRHDDLRGMTTGTNDNRGPTATGDQLQPGTNYNREPTTLLSPWTRQPERLARGVARAEPVRERSIDLAEIDLGG